MIPENKQRAVKIALQTAFGVNEFEDIQPLRKGLSSALVFKIIVRENPYLLRVITRTDAMADPTHYFACMKLAAEAELAPRIHYLSIADRISITDFVEAQSTTFFNTCSTGKDGAFASKIAFITEVSVSH